MEMGTGTGPRLGKGGFILTTDDTARIRRDELLERAVVQGPRDRGVITVLVGATPGMLYTLDHDVTVIGRGGEAEVLVSETGVSRRHAAIERIGDGFVLRDLGSTNGTSLDGVPVTAPMTLHDGARIGLGSGTILGFSLRDAVEQAAARQTHDLAMRDPLTGLYNRRHLAERLSSELAYARRHNAAISALLIDIDRFKAVNDQHGHSVGDHVLRLVAAQLTGVVRCEDVLARFGGEEFLVIARGIDEAGATALGERIRSSMAQVNVPGAASLHITVSVGIAHAPEGSASPAQQLLRLADETLYRAKDGGRDRVELSRVASPTETMRQLPVPYDRDE